MRLLTTNRFQCKSALYVFPNHFYLLSIYYSIVFLSHSHPLALSSLHDIQLYRRLRSSDQWEYGLFLIRFIFASVLSFFCCFFYANLMFSIKQMRVHTVVQRTENADTPGERSKMYHKRKSSETFNLKYIDWETRIMRSVDMTIIMMITLLVIVCRATRDACIDRIKLRIGLCINEQTNNC